MALDSIDGLRGGILRSFICCCAAFLALAARPAGALRPLTVEDTLTLETVSEAQASPDGRYILLIETLPAAQRTDFSQDVIFGPKSGRLLAIDLLGGPEPSPLIDVPGETYALGSFSPDSRRVLVYWMSGGKMGLGCYDFAAKRYTRFAATPQSHSRTDFQPAWLSDDEILYAAEPAGEQPVELFGRPEAARKLSELRARSWAGRQPAVVVSESRSDGGGREPRRGSLVRADVRTGATQVVADGLFSDLRLSGDRRFLAALRQYSSAQPPLSLNVDWQSEVRAQVVIFDLRGGAEVYASDGLTAGLGSLEWAPKDEKLAFFAWDPAGTSSSGLYRVYDVDSRRLSSRPHRGLDLVSERERGYFPRPERAAWLGDGLAVAARPRSSPAADPTFTHRDYARAGPEPGIGWYLLGPEGTVRPLTAGLKSVSPIRALAGDDRLVIIADDQLWQVSPDGSRTLFLDRPYEGLSLAFPPGMVRPAVQTNPIVLVSSSGGRTTYLLADPVRRRPSAHIEAGPGESALAVSATGVALLADEAGLSTRILLREGERETPLLHLNRQLDEVDLGDRRQIAYAGAKGEELTACLLLPPGYVPGRRYPMIVNIYPGVTGRCGPKTVNFFSDSELLAAHGYLVLRPGNPPATDRTPEGPIAGMAPAVEKAIDAAVAQGYADPGRIGLWGSSQGGFSSLWLATQMSRFKAVVSSQGWADLASHYLGADYQNLIFPDYAPYTLHTARYEPAAGSEFSIGRTLWEAPEIYVRNSPTMHADTVSAPVMLISSDMDIFPLWQYQEMYTALYRLRKPACFVVYMGEGHWPQSPANVRDLWKRTFGWFDSHLNGGPVAGCATAVPSGSSAEVRQ